MKRGLSFILSLIMVIGIITSVPITVSAASESALTFSLNSDGNSYYVQDCITSASGEITIPNTYNGKPVTRLGNYVFEDCTSLTSITIPDSITIIGNCAFESCRSLTTITIPDSVTSIGDYAFSDCTSLTSIIVDSNNVFYSSVDGVLFNKDVSRLIIYPMNKKNSAYKIPATVQSIAPLAFNENNNLISITIPSSVKFIEGSNFCSCTKLSDISITDSIIKIENSLFYNSAYYNQASNWENDLLYVGNHLIASKGYKSSFNIRNGTKTIAGGVFSSPLITDITIPDGVTSIGDYAFAYCSLLKYIVIPSSVKYIGDNAFKSVQDCSVKITDLAAWCAIEFGNENSNPLKGQRTVYDIGCETTYYSSLYVNGVFASSIVIPQNVTSIGAYAFYGYRKLSSITFSGNVKEIGEDAFTYCGVESIYIEDLAAWCSIDFANADANPMNREVDLYIQGVKCTHIVIRSGITSIADWAFYNSSITSVTIPEGVTRIGSGSFSNCLYLDSINIPSSLKEINSGAFISSYIDSVYITDVGAWCEINFKNEYSNPLHTLGKLYLNNSLVENLVVPDGVKKISDYAFYNNSRIRSVELPDSVISIGAYAFYDCLSLSSITIPKSLKRIGKYAFRGSEISNLYIEDLAAWCSIDFEDETATPLCYSAHNPPYDYQNIYINKILSNSIIIPDGTTKINNFAFSKFRTIKNITIPDSVTSIGEYAFGNCTNLTGITIPDSVTSIGEKAFWNCSNLTGITIPDGVTSIGDYAFYGCDRLESITIGDSVTSIGDAAFRYCESLTSIYVDENNTEYFSVDGVLFNKDKTILIQYPPDKADAEYTIPDSVTSIGDWAFFDCSSLTSITIPDSVTSIGDYAFYYCTSLTSITIPDSVTSIGSDAFEDCTSLTSITIPDSVTSIGSDAFYKCESLTSIIIPSSVTSIGSDAFEDCTSLTSIAIPDGVTSIGNEAFYNTAYYNDSNNWENGVLYIDNHLVETNGSITGAYEIKNGTKTIADYAFRNSTKLTKITFPNSVTSIGDGAFEYCKSLKSITIPDSVKSIGFDAFSSCYSLSEVTTSCNSYASTCFNVSKLKLIHNPTEEWIIEKNPTCINEGSKFRQCSRCDAKTDITVITPTEHEYVNGICSVCGNTVGMEYLTFELNEDGNSYSVTDCNKSISGEIIIPSTYNGLPVTSIGEEVFSYCTSLTSVTIGNNVKGIGYRTFEYCDSLVTVKIGNGVSYIGYSAFDSCNSLTSIEIPDSVTRILGYAFSNCTRLTSITIPDSVTSIGGYAFSNCTSLTSIEIPDRVTSIEGYTFENCTSLTSVTIPDSVTSIVEEAFFGCKNLDDVYYSGSLTQWNKIKVEGNNWELNSATFHFAIVEKPATPKLTSATRVSNGVKVSWNRVLGSDSYIVYRKTSKSGWTNLGTTTGTSFTDTKAKTGTTYYYTVKAQNDAGASGYNKTGLKIKFVAAPKLTKIANESSGVRVYWSKVSGADGYYLYRRVAGSKTWTKIATIKKGSTTSYLDKKASAGKTYEYIIKCYDGSTPSASAAKLIKIKRLTVPKLVSAKSAKAGITVKWGKVSGAEGYYVYRKTGSGSWVKLTTVKGNTKVSYVDKSAKKGKTYTYTVKAYSGSYTSAYNTKGLKIKDKY